MSGPLGAQEVEGQPGWYHRGPFAPGHFAAVAVGRMQFRVEPDGTARCRFFPTELHLNISESVHGGAVMSFIDMALFAGGHICGMPEGHYVTLDCATHFIAPVMPGAPFDIVVRLVGATRGGMVFLSGHCEQDGATTHSFTGTLKRVKPRA
ncbi:MAG: PaaI family thioesterase [Sphingomicrobium sp.]